MVACDLVWLHQYLGSDLVFDVFNAAAQDQTLLLTSLGYEPLGDLFWRQAPRRRKMAFVEISDYACSRVHLPNVLRIGMKAAIWRRELRPEVPDAPRDRSHYCAIGRVLPHKGFETAVLALPEGGTLSIAGILDQEPTYAEMLRALPAKGRAHWMGQINDGEKSELLTRSAALIACSTHVLHDGRRVDQPELLGLVLLEAVNAGCLPICTRIPSFNEVMADLELTEWQFDERDHDGLRELLRRLVQIPGEALQVQLKTARTRLVRNYLWDDYWTRVRTALPDLFPG
jgi:glycosyltransferase involved in cell wall biosynthesis